MNPLSKIQTQHEELSHNLPTTCEKRKEYYEKNGYIVYPKLIDAALCDEAMACFRKEIKSFEGFIYRQASANPERNVFDKAGNVLNSLLNPIAVNTKLFPTFREISQRLLTAQSLYTAVEELIGPDPLMVQSMYFEGNPATWAHQDSYYLDGEKLGSMVAAWIALENIDERAGRFYVGVGSHRIDMAKNGGDFNIAEHHDRYKQLVLDIIEKLRVELRAPALKKGDVLFWNSKTIHGSLESTDPHYSRNSYTAHFIPASMRFLKLQSIAQTLKPQRIHERAAYIPKDQTLFRNQVILKIECIFPNVFRFFKKLAVKFTLNR